MLRKIITNSAIMHFAYTRLAILYCKSKVFWISKYLNENGMKVCSREEIINGVKKRSDLKSSKVCHVIGSGWSLNRSKYAINADDFVIGFNFAGIQKLSYDAYFVEFGGPTVKATARAHKRIIEEVVLNSTDLVYFKNLWESKNDKVFISAEWGGAVKYVKDYVMPCLREESLRSILVRCLDDSSQFLPQYTSTALTCVFLMYFCGFKEIVLHGIDFGGQYFYEAPDFNGNADLIPSPNSTEKFYQATTAQSVHPTASSSVGMKEAIPILAKLLCARGVNLYSAHQSSPLSKYLPIYLK